MSTPAKRPSRIVVVLKLPEDEVPLLVLQARAIVQGMTGNPWFPSPSPPLAVVQSAIDDLFEAETEVGTGRHGSAAARDEKRVVLVAHLQQLRAYVEVIATANPEHAASIAESARMYLKKPGGRTPQVFGAKRGRVSGEVDVVAPNAGDRAAYEFQYGLDGGVTWLPFSPPVTNKASATRDGLKPGSTVHFRVRATVKGVTGNWSDPISIIVD